MSPSGESDVRVMCGDAMMTHVAQALMIDGEKRFWKVINDYGSQQGTIPARRDRQPQTLRPL